MSDSRDGAAVGWPVALRGVTESVVTTKGPNGRWNVAALGLFAPEAGRGDDDARSTDDGGDPSPAAPVTARTWGRTRTWRNFSERGGGCVQFTRDPVTFVDAACSVWEVDTPVLEGADAWVDVEVESVAAGVDGDTRWVEWALSPRESAVERRVVPTTNRGYNAVVEATVAVSRLDVPAYDRSALEERFAYFASVVDRCGGPRERTALERLRRHADLES